MTELLKHILLKTKLRAPPRDATAENHSVFSRQANVVVYQLSFPNAIHYPRYEDQSCTLKLCLYTTCRVSREVDSAYGHTNLVSKCERTFAFWCCVEMNAAPLFFAFDGSADQVECEAWRMAGSRTYSLFHAERSVILPARTLGVDFIVILLVIARLVPGMLCTVLLATLYDHQMAAG